MISADSVGVASYTVLGNLIESRRARGAADEGEGISRIFEETEESFLRDPERGVEEGLLVVRLFNHQISLGPNSAWKKLVGDLPVSAGGFQASEAPGRGAHYVAQPKLGRLRK